MLLDRVSSKIEVADGCWLWRGCIDPAGYGRVWSHGKKLAHRVVYESLRGEIEGELHHTCETRSCVNPAHLLDVSKRAHRREHISTVCPHGHPFDDDNVRIRVHSDGRVQRVCMTCNRDAGRRFRERRASNVVNG